MNFGVEEEEADKGNDSEDDESQDIFVGKIVGRVFYFLTAFASGFNKTRNVKSDRGKEDWTKCCKTLLAITDAEVKFILTLHTVNEMVEI